MSAVVPKPLADLIEELGHLPGVGPRSAERFAYYLFKNGPQAAKELSSSITRLHNGIKICPVTFALIEANQQVSPLYNDPKRDKSVIAVVAEPLDIAVLEKTNSFNGTYHVLGGLLSPIDDMGPEKLKINELVKRIKKDHVKEIILAINASVEGESTALLIADKVNSLKVKVTRLARGLPVGVDLEYADQMTLARAIAERQTL